MAEVNPPLWLQGGSYAASTDRLLTSLLIDRNVTPSGLYNTTAGVGALNGGVIGPPSDLKVTADGSTMNLTVSAGMAVIPTQSLNPPGTYVVYNDNPKVVAVDPAVSFSRYDILVARVRDETAGDLTSAWSLEMIKGTETSGLNDPTLPPNCIPLARIWVKKASENGGVNKIVFEGAGNQVFDRRRFVSGHGGVNISWDGTMPPLSPGRMCYVVGTKIMQYSDGLTWFPLWTQKEVVAYLKTFGYQAKYIPEKLKLPVNDTTKDTWVWYIRAADTNTQIAAPIETGLVNNPHGYLEVKTSGMGKASAGVSGHMSVEIYNAAGTRVAGGPGPVAGQTSGYDWGISFYSTSYVSSAQSMVFSLPTGTSYKARMVFRALGSAGDFWYLDRGRVSIEALLRG